MLDYFMGSNLRATQNPAHNMAKAIKQASLPEPAHAAPVQNGKSEPAP
jgi:hypothetical protein